MTFPRIGRTPVGVQVKGKGIVSVLITYWREESTYHVLDADIATKDYLGLTFDEVVTVLNQAMRAVETGSLSRQ